MPVHVYNVLFFESVTYQVVPGNEFFDHLGEHWNLNGDSSILIIMAEFFTDTAIWGEILHNGIHLPFLINTLFPMNFAQIEE